MSDSSYKGDSPGKKVTRLRLWLNIRAIFQALQIPYVGTLVLAGEGGDLSVLKALGTDLTTVVAIDYDPFLIEWCSELYPEVLSLVGEAGETSEVADYNIAHLDYNGGIRNAANIVTFAKVARHLQSHPALIALTMQKCREGSSALGPSRLLAGVPRATQERLFKQAQESGDQVGAHIFQGNRFDSRFVLSHSEARLRKMLPFNNNTIERGFYRPRGLGNLGHALIRADAMRWCAEWLLTAWGTPEPIVLRLIGTYTYHSETKHDHGQPYLTALYAVTPKAQEHTVMAALNSVGVQRFDCWDKKASRSGLKPTALELAKHIPDIQVAQMLNIEHVRVQSWMVEGITEAAPFPIEDLLQIPWSGFKFKG
jgi:hypothetical protein